MLVAGGSTNVTTYFAMRLTADGTAATGLTATNFDLQFVRSGSAPSVKADATAGTAGGAAAHVDNTVVEPDATDQPGLYRVDWPDAAFSAGVREVILTVKVATAFTEHLRVEIDGEVNVVEWAGTDVVAGAIPAAAADAAGGLPVSDAGGLDLDTKLASTNEVTAARMGALTDWINGGRLDLILDIIAADVVNIDGAAMRGTDSAALASVCTEARLSELDAVTAGKMANQVDEIRTDTGEIGAAGAGLTNINLPDQTMNITGNLSGSVGSVTGAVGSVTGAVGSVTGAVGSVAGNVDGNVTGSVGSLAAQAKIDVNAEVDTALDTAIPELGVAAPTATPTVRTGLMLLYMPLRNKLVVQTSGTDAIEIYNDAGTKIASKLITDDGSDYTEAEMS